ncbi:hypothetical protein DFJ74DRAFT_344551 [Hyaloraphidium curvatum]|nr:hypothetical protein DFJ74DRAFT_344551 [Hyaloraphidium curvatum]
MPRPASDRRPSGHHLDAPAADPRVPQPHRNPLPDAGQPLACFGPLRHVDAQSLGGVLPQDRLLQRGGRIRPGARIGHRGGRGEGLFRGDCEGAGREEVRMGGRSPYELGHGMKHVQLRPARFSEGPAAVCRRVARAAITNHCMHPAPAMHVPAASRKGELLEAHNIAPSRNECIASGFFRTGADFGDSLSSAYSPSPRTQKGDSTTTHHRSTPTSSPIKMLAKGLLPVFVAVIALLVSSAGAMHDVTVDHCPFPGTQKVCGYNGTDNTLICVNYLTDPMHCGNCDVKCRIGATCDQGRCSSGCAIDNGNGTVGTCVRGSFIWENTPTLAHCDPANNLCRCTLTAEGGGFCSQIGSCYTTGVVDCKRSIDCRNGEVCIMETCCTSSIGQARNICIPQGSCWGFGYVEPTPPPPPHGGGGGGGGSGSSARRRRDDKAAAAVAEGGTWGG